MSDLRLSPERIARAAASIDPVFRGTPQFLAESLRAPLGAEVVLKIETMNPIGSFKGRGTDYFVRELPVKPPALVCASAGNFGQGLAYAGRRAGLAVHVFAATTANALKIERMRALGAQVSLVGRDLDEAKAHARTYASEQGMRFVEDGLEPAIAEGAGTIARELVAGPWKFDTLVIPLGNGALATGMGCWARYSAPTTRVVAVAAAGAPSMRDSFVAGIPLERPCQTIADGIAVRVPVREAVSDMRTTIDDVLIVTDAQLVAAIRLIWERVGLLVEPAGVAGIAALMAYPDLFRGQTVGVPLCGGNVTMEQRREWLA